MGPRPQGGSDRERLSRAVRGAQGDEAEPKSGQPGAAEDSPPSVHFRVLPCVYACVHVCVCTCVHAHV